MEARNDGGDRATGSATLSTAIACRSSGDPRKSRRRRPGRRRAKVRSRPCVPSSAAHRYRRREATPWPPAAATAAARAAARGRCGWRTRPVRAPTALETPSAARAPGVRVMFRVGSVIFRGKACLVRACARVFSGPSVCRSHRARSRRGWCAWGEEGVDRHQCLRDAAAQ